MARTRDGKKRARSGNGVGPGPVAALRKQHAAVWLEIRGFQADFELNGADFMAHELGLQPCFVAELLKGRQHLDNGAALGMRRMISGKAQAANFDYRVFTEAVSELTGTPAGPPAPTNGAVVVSNGETPEPGYDTDGRPVLVITLADGHKAAVILPKGTKVDGLPKVLFGVTNETGSITLVLVKEEAKEETE